MEFSADVVWALAVAANDINDGYYKESIYNYEDGKLEKQANKVMVKSWLAEQAFDHLTDQDYETGKQLRKHFKAYTLKALADNLNDFQRTVMRIANKDVFLGTDLVEFSIISSLPSVAERDRKHAEIKREAFSSEPIQGDEGDTIIGDVTVISSQFNYMYNRHKIYARMGESIVDFWYGMELKPGTEIHISAKIKQIRPDNTTQLNYVRKKRSRG